MWAVRVGTGWPVSCSIWVMGLSIVGAKLAHGAPALGGIGAREVVDQVVTGRAFGRRHLRLGAALDARDLQMRGLALLRMRAQRVGGDLELADLFAVGARELVRQLRWRCRTRARAPHLLRHFLGDGAALGGLLGRLLVVLGLLRPGLLHRLLALRPRR